MKIKEALICILVCGIIAIFLVEACVMCDAVTAVEPDISYLDLNNDGAINIADVMILVSAFNSCSGDSRYTARLDLNSDDAINIADVLIIAKYFNRVVSVPTSTYTPPPTQTSIPTPTNKFSQEADFDFDAATGIILKYKGSDGEVNIPNIINGVRVTGIGRKAFYDCDIKSVTIPDGVTSIGNSAFGSCNGLTSITIPKSVTSIGDFAFEYCGSLREAVFLGNEPNLGQDIFYCSIGNDFRVVVLPTATGFGKPNLSKDETSWNWYAGRYVDYDCKVVISGSEIDVPDFTLNAFTGTIIRYKGDGGDVIIPDAINGVSVTGIGAYAFSGCNEPICITIPGSVKSIGNQAFYYCSGLTDITIPESVTSIGEYAFYCCRGLTSITLPQGLKSIGRYAFAGCSGMTGITIPESVESIGEYLFDNCSGLTSITIPEGVTGIPMCTFHGCSRLTKVTIPESVTSIGAGAFWCCSGLTSITIPEGVKDIQSNAFDSCNGLTSIIIPENVTSIGYWAFQNCSSLSKVVFLGEQPTEFGSSVFKDTKGDLQIIVPPAATGFGKPDPYNNETYWNWVPEGNDVFRVVISGTVAPIQIPAIAGQIADEADFDFCTATGTILKYKGSGGDVTIPDVIKGVSVTGIGERAFSSCSRLTSLTMPESVKSVGNGAFCECSGLTSIIIPEGVTSISESTFSYCSRLISVTLPESLKSIENCAFYECSGLASITLPKGLTRIGYCAFIASGLTSITIPESVTSIEDGAFQYCGGLTSITIPENVISIGSHAFADCSELSNAIFLGNQPANFGPRVFVSGGLPVFQNEDFKITVSPTATGFGKPNPYNNETSWYWAPNDNFTYKVVISDIDI